MATLRRLYMVDRMSLLVFVGLPRIKRLTVARAFGEIGQISPVVPCRQEVDVFDDDEL
jgi:hypothetical protein